MVRKPAGASTSSPTPGPLSTITTTSTPAPRVPEQSQPVPVPAVPTVPAAITTPAQPLSIVVDTTSPIWKINPHIPLFTSQPHLKRCIALAIERAINEVITPVMERSATIASITTRELIMKDFAMEPDENGMLRSATTMVQNLAGSLAMVTCKEPLRVSIANHLRALLQANVPDAQRSLIEPAVQTVCTDNLDAACSLIERTTIEKGLHLTNEALEPAVEARIKHRERPTGQPYVDAACFQGRYPSSLPELLRPKPGGLQVHQRRVYEDFGEGNMPISHVGSPLAVSPIRHVQQAGQFQGLRGAEDSFKVIGSNQSGTLESSGALGKTKKDAGGTTVREALGQFKSLMSELDTAVLTSRPEEEIRLMVEEGLTATVENSVSPNEVAMAFAQKAFKLLYEQCDNQALIYLNVLVLVHIRALCKGVVKELTNWILYSDDEKKFHKKITVRLLHAHLVKVSEFDVHLAKRIENSRNKPPIDFAIALVQKSLLANPTTLAVTDLSATLDALDKIARRNSGPEGLAELIAAARAAPTPPSSPPQSGTSLVDKLSSNVDKRAQKAKKEEFGPANEAMQEQAADLFEEWKRQLGTGNQAEKTLLPFVSQLQRGVLQADASVVKTFFLTCVRLAIDQTHHLPSSNQMNYRSVDALIRLVVLLYKYSGEGGATTPGTRQFLIARVLDSIVMVLLKTQEIRKVKFNQRPFFRLIGSLMTDLIALTPDTDASHLQLLLPFSNALRLLVPNRVPGFALGWLELVSHRVFMPKLLLSKSQQGWAFFQQLLIELLRFLEPYLRSADLHEPIRLLYKGTLRLLLVLLHDFPEFLADNHFAFCDVIPPRPA
eukprot:TRINITY_DN3617_c0_g1_i3.p1 TRINITY_DN3617_c0_g1~~TRINITY_DN3617_c0_g1_i3.p1  ORF type:complete len:835 (+),score=127.59 TRINITY_DN3617_c0_g1_i3:1-2505(+)